MRIHVKYYAAIRDIVGFSSEDIDVDESTKLGSLIIMIKEKHDRIKDLILLIAVNEKYSSSERILVEGDRVALFPPVSGG